MKITRKWLEKHKACHDGKEWFLAEGKLDAVEGIKNLIAKDKLDWANWLVARVLNQKQKIQYAVFAAEQAIDIYEKKYPGNDRPRKAIEAAKKVIKSNTQKNRAAAYAAANAAADAAAEAAMKKRILEYGISLIAGRPFEKTPEQIAKEKWIANGERMGFAKNGKVLA